jgi:hypothetical protein
MRTTATWLVAMTMVLSLTSVASAQRCFVAYVHGHGPNYLGASQQAIENGYWADSTDSGYNTMQSWSSFDYYSAGTRGCTTFLVGYDGTQYFWDTNAAGAVADQINGFINNNGIGNQSGDRLIVVAHSMGGLVVRWIMNNGAAGSPYYNYAGHNYANIVNHTTAFITVQSPHSGTETADALYGNADTWYSNAAGAVLQLFGVVSADNGTAAMTRSYMQGAGSSGGWMGDAYRHTRMYTIAGYTTYDHAGAGESNDGSLAEAFGAICNRAHNINGGFCHEYYGENGDGLVEELSATGRRQSYYGSDPNGGGSGWEFDPNVWNIIAGARTDWLRIEHDHEQGRHDHLQANIRNCTALNCGDITCETAVNTGTYCDSWPWNWCDNNTHCVNNRCSSHNDTGFGTSCNSTASAVSTTYWPGSYIGNYINSLSP